MKFKKSFGIIGILLLVFLLASCSPMSKAEKLENYEVEENLIPSITSVVGERKVVRVKTGTENGIRSKEYEYVSDDVFDDLFDYVLHLMNDGWTVTKDIDLNKIPGSGQFAKHAKEEGKIIMLDFDYDLSGYTVIITHGKGTIDMH